MKKKRFSVEQIVGVGSRLRWGCRGRADPEGGHQRADVLPLEEAIRALESEQVREMKQLQDENSLGLKKLVADLRLDKTMLQDVLRKKW